MKNEHDESKKILLGLLVGGIVGAGALYYFRAVHNRKEPVLKKIGKTITEVGEMIENCNFGSGSCTLNKIEKHMPTESDVFSNLTDWLGAGMSLWKKFKNG